MSQKLAKVSLFVVLTLVSLISAVHVRQPEIATAATSSNLNFQARLLNAAGNTVPDGYYNVEFNLYNASSGGTTLWTETYYDSNGVTAGNDNRLRVVNGYLSANLGSLTAFSTTINWDQEHWITMNIGGSTQTATPTWDGEMNPRLKLTAVPYAFKAGELAKTTGGNVSTLKFDTQTAANSILLPDEAGTLCIRNSTNCGFAASSGSANYIQNGTTGQTANFNIQSASSSSVTGVLQGASSQTADLLQFKDSSGVILTAFDSAGKLIFGPSGSQDTNLYRSAANTLKTDDDFIVGGTLAVTGTQTFTGNGTFNGGLTVANNSNFSQTGSGTFSTGTGSVSLNGDTAIAAGKSLTVVGGNTASRPGSPAEGMVYYDTTTKQLLTYANGKWQQDRTDAILVAAGNSSQSDKDAADYVADGNTGAANDGDQIQINSALSAASGKKVVLLAGTYVADATILVPNNTTLSGIGKGTIIQLSVGSSSDNLIENSDSTTGEGVTIKNLSLDGSLGTGGTQNGIRLDTVGSSTRNGATIDNVVSKEFTNDGISVVDTYGALIDGITTSDNGRHGLNVDNGSENKYIHIINSISNNNTQSGFQITSWNNVVVSNNTANNNGAAGYVIGATSSTITGNNANSNQTGFFFNAITNSTISGNLASNSSLNNFNLYNSSNNIFDGNTSENSGDTTDNNGINIHPDSDFNTITNNLIIDSGCTTTCYAINIVDATSAKNYLEGNRFTGSAANSASINDAGTGTIYAGQQTNGTTSSSSDVSDFLFRGSANSNSAFRIQNASGQNLLIADTTNQRLAVGPASVPANGVLTVGTATTTAAGGIYFGTDVNLYRSAADTLKTDDSLDVAINIAVGGNFLQSGTGTFGTGTGAVSLNGATSVTGSNAFNVGTGTSTFAGGNITQTGSGTFGTGTGAVSLNGDVTVASGKDLTINGGTGSQFTNNSSTLNTALALGDLAAGSLGANTATVDIKTSFTIAPTVAGRTYTIPTPSDTTAGRIIYISNVHGSNNFIIGSATFNAGTTGSFVWDGNGWRAAGIDTGVTTVGSLNGGTANATGATITGTTIYLQSASTSYAGLVDTTTQTFTGDKTFKSTTNSTSALNIQNAAGSNALSVDTTPINTIISNQSFEPGTTGWLLNGTGASIAQNFSNKYVGSASMAVTTGANTNTGAKYVTANSAPTQLATSTTYTFSWYAKLASGTFTDIIGGYARDGTTQTNCTGINTQTVSTTGWTRFSCTIATDGTTPAAGAYIYINQTAGTARTFYVDGVQIETGSTATAFKESGISLNGVISSPLSLKNQENSTTAFNIQNAAGGVLFNVDTLNAKTTVKSTTDNTAAFSIQNSSSTNLLVADTSSMRVSVGSIGTATGQVYVSGTLPSAYLGSVALPTCGFTGGYNIASQGRYAYVSAFGCLASYDMSNPATPVALTTVSITNSAAQSVVVAGKYAYIATNSPSIDIVDISNPRSMTLVSSTSVAAFTQPKSIAVQGRYLYIVGSTGTTMGVYDIANPVVPVALGTLSLGASSSPYAINVQGKYAYIGQSSASGVTFRVVDVSNPSSLSSVGTINSGSIPSSIWIQDKYAYTFDAGTIRIFDISNPASPSLTGSVGVTGAGRMIAVQGRTLYLITSSSGAKMQMFDVSNPASPSSIGTVALSGGSTGQAITVQGRYVYAMDDSGVLNTFDVGGTYSQQLEAGGIETGTLGVRSLATFSSSVDIKGGLTVGSSINLQGNLSTGGTVLFSSNTNSTTALRVATASNSDVITVDTTPINTIISNQSFEPGTTGWLLNGTGASIAQNFSNKYVGSASMAVTTGANTNTGAKYVTANSAPTQLATSTTYTFSWYAKLASGTFTDIIGGYARDGTTQTNCTGINTQTVSTTGWTRFSCTIATDGTTPAAGAYIYINQTAGTARTFYVDGVQIETGSTATAFKESGISLNGVISSPLSLKNQENSTTAFNIQNAAGTSILNVDTLNGRIGIGTTAATGDLTFGESASTRTINTQTRTTNAIGTSVTISAGSAGSGASAFAGGVLTLQGGAAGGTGNANGGAVTISGGAAVGSGTQGLVNLATSAFTSASEQAFTSSTSITAGNVDLYSSLPVKANTNTGSVLTIPDPAQATIGRLLYVSARSGSLDFTMRLNSARTPIDIAMKQNSTATLIWNGTDWTAAGASSSTDLQSAYNNTLTSAGGAELVLNAPGGNADGLTIRNNATTPITGGILEVQTSIGSNLFSVNNNATEYATNGGAETQGASSSTFPASTWGAAPAGGTVSRNTTSTNNATGTASVSVVTTTTSHGAADTLSAALTANLQYTVSFTVKGATNFSTLDVIYSRDGTNTSTTTCTTGKTVTTSVWSRITCTFTAPSSGISALNAIFIRQSDATGRTFYIDNLSVNVNASVNHAADGSVDSALGTNWTDFGTNGSGTTTVVRNTSTIYDTSGSVEKTTGATATKGIRNNMPITPSVSTQYLVTFYARSSNTFTDITAGFLPAGGDTAPISAQQCTDYNTQTVSTTGWTKITCIVTTPSSGISDPDIVIYQPTGTARTFYVDALTVTLNTNTASNVQVGQGNKGGPTTLFTLDRSSTAPIADNNDAYLGSMYYDTTSGRIQCYEADGWGACGAAPDNIVNLNPEFAGAVLNGSGVGTMSADFCGNGGGLSVNTGLCTSGQARNYYKWTSPQASQQTYSIYVTYQLPASFKNFASDDTVQLTARTDNTTNGVVTYEMFRNESGAISACGTETTVTTSVDTWQTVGVNGNESTGCSFSTSSANAFVIFKINVKANSNANVYVGTLSFTTAGR